MTITTSRTPDSLPGVSGVKQASDQALHSAEKAVDNTRVYANDALDRAEDKVRELRGNVDPMIEAMAMKAQKLARQSLDIAAEAKEKAQQSLSRYASATTQYVSEQPVRSVLIAAAVGAAVALLVSASRNRNRY
ncbi:MAG: hypothetical protein HYX42_13620 [Polaromonas sp.]|uniref:hypothetical protein n=1 Tax=Polaromonas sp. TaxID=1869339 RepID=UPI0025CF6201|nr:hypothetical protein [Polaromonas sp.]MBI2727277.1 hypothetical protein [Polaromonas sp.]